MTDHSRDYFEAEVNHLYRVLHGYGTLTRERLWIECGGEHWLKPGEYRRALDAAHAQGRVKLLGNELIEVVEPAA